MSTRKQPKVISVEAPQGPYEQALPSIILHHPTCLASRPSLTRNVEDNEIKDAFGLPPQAVHRGSPCYGGRIVAQGRAEGERRFKKC